MNTPERFDLIVIGSGPAGRRAAVQAAKLGKSVLVVENRLRVGGVSVHTGTIPSKTLREAVIHLTGLRHRGLYGRSYRVIPQVPRDYRLNESWLTRYQIRTASGITMEEAGTLISLVQVPVGSLVEEIDGMRLVHANVSVREEVRLALQDLLRSMGSRSPGGIRNQLAILRTDKLIVGDTKTGYLLTQAGHAAAYSVPQRGHRVVGTRCGVSCVGNDDLDAACRLTDRA